MVFRPGLDKKSDGKRIVSKSTDAETVSDADLQGLKERLDRASPAQCSPTTARPKESTPKSRSRAHPTSHPPSTDREELSSSANERVDSPMQDLLAQLTKPCFPTLNASPTPAPRAPLKDCKKSLRDRRVTSKSSKTSEWKIQNWRQAPEKLNDAEKDILQKAIQESYQKMQEKKENFEKMDESEIGAADSEEDMSFEY